MKGDRKTIKYIKKPVKKKKGITFFNYFALFIAFAMVLSSLLQSAYYYGVIGFIRPVSRYYIFFYHAIVLSVSLLVFSKLTVRMIL